MLLPEEQCVVNWLYQYGALPKIQVMKLLNMPEVKAERLLYTLRRSLRITEVLDGSYVALDPLAKPDQRLIQAVWVLAKFIDKLEDPKAHYAATYPSQIFFLKESIEINMVSDTVAMHTMKDDGSAVCWHFYCSVPGAEDRTEVYVVPQDELRFFLDLLPNISDEGVKLHEKKV